MRNKFDEQLEQLNIELIKMGALCEEAIHYACQALLKQDDELVLKTFAVDSEIDSKERDVESLCMKLLLQQQPVARDLRVISSALKMIADMERIGDQASDIAEISRHIKIDADIKSKVHITDMAKATTKMVTDSVESFVKQDMNLVYYVMEYDDVVDRLFDEIKKELTDIVRSDKEHGELSLDFLMVAKYFERIGDHAVNIAEWVEYSITGSHTNNEHSRL